MRGYTKTTATGSEDCIILAPKETYTRQTNLPPNWAKCRLGMFYSFVGLAGDDAPSVTETNTRYSILDDFHFGLSNGIGIPGQPENRFLGFASMNQVQSLTRAASNDVYNPGGKDGYEFAALGWNGTARIERQYYTQHSLSSGRAEHSTTFAGFMGLDFAIAGTIATVSLGFSNATTWASITDVSALALRARMANPEAYMYPDEGTMPGWWEPGNVGIRHVSIRCPLPNNRLRIHAVEVMQLA